MEDDGDFFNIDIDSTSDIEASPTKLKQPRDHQSAADFQRTKSEWRPKIEAGEIWKTLKLPISNPSKVESQTVLHAIEELYFFGRFELAARIAGRALKGELQREFRAVLQRYYDMCLAKLAGVKEGGV